MTDHLNRPPTAAEEKAKEATQEFLAQLSTIWGQPIAPTLTSDAAFEISYGSGRIVNGWHGTSPEYGHLHAVLTLWEDGQSLADWDLAFTHDDLWDFDEADLADYRAFLATTLDRLR